jgi:hypothetical protein
MYKSGFSVMLLTIIISAVGVAIAISALSDSTQIAKTNINVTDANINKSKASGCVEKVFTKLRAYKFYGGDETFTDGCRVYTIAGNGNGVRIIYTKVDSIILETKINQITPKIVIDYQKQITTTQLNTAQQNNPYLIDPLALRLWFKADRAETNNGQAVLSLPNATDDLNIPFSQVSTAPNLAPKLITNAINSRPVLRFDGVDDFLTSTTSSIHTNSGLSIIAVAKTANTSNADQTYIAKFDTTNNEREWRLQNDEFNIVSNTLTFTNNNTNFNILNALWSPTSPELSLSINNNSATTATGAPNITTTSEPIIVGANLQGSAGFLNGDIAEILVYNKKLSTDELNKIRTYFNSKYNIY